MAEAGVLPSAAERVAAAETAVPGALALASLLPHAARIERRLLRALRVDVMPQLSAADEAELWSSDLVEVRAIDGLVLRADVQEILRQRGRALLQQRARRGAAAERAGRLRAANELLLQHHANAPPLVRLEEEIAWLAMEMAEPRPAIERRLEVALAALVRDGRTGVARWAARALPRLPEVARGLTAAWQLSVASSDKLPASRHAALPLPVDMQMVDLQALAPHLGRVPLGVRRIGDRIEIGATGPGSVALMVPATEPRFIELLGPFVPRDTTLKLTFPAGSLARHGVDWGQLTLQAADGRRWEIPVWSEAESRWLKGVVALRPHLRHPQLGTVVADGRVLSLSSSAEPGQPASFRIFHLRPPGAVPLPLAAKVPEDARVVSVCLDRKGNQQQVVGTWSNAGADGPTVRARAAGPAETCLGAPIVFEGQLAGIVTRAIGGPRGRADDVVLHVENRPERLLADHSSQGTATSAISVELLPARHGQAVLLGWGPQDDRHHLLVDGGPQLAAKHVVARVREALGGERKLELIAISHAGGDRLEGINDLLGAGISAQDIWFNGPTVLARFGATRAYSPAVEHLEEHIRRKSSDPQNGAFGGQPIIVPPEGPLPRIEFAGGASITVLGPSERALTAMVNAWNHDAVPVERVYGEPLFRLPPEALASWTRRNARRANLGGDTRPNNGASLVLLFEYQGHSVLLPGDAPRAPLLAALRRLLAERGRTGMFIDVFVMPHGGSRSTIVPALFELIEAGIWAVSTDGSIRGRPDAVAMALVGRHSPGSTLAFNYRSKTTERWGTDSFQRKHNLRVVLPDRPEGGIELAVGTITEHRQSAR